MNFLFLLKIGIFVLNMNLQKGNLKKSGIINCSLFWNIFISKCIKAEQYTLKVIENNQEIPRSSYTNFILETN